MSLDTAFTLAFEQAQRDLEDKERRRLDRAARSVSALQRVCVEAPKREMARCARTGTSITAIAVAMHIPKRRIERQLTGALARYR